MSSEPENDPKPAGLIKKLPNFRHVGRFWSSGPDLSVGQAGANCETLLGVKSMFTHLHIMPKPLFSLKNTFSN